MSWIRFEELTPNPATQRWAVRPTDGSAEIGRVQWYGPWRKYCFMPAADCVFEQVCLREIATFCEDATQRHRTAKAARGSRLETGAPSITADAPAKAPAAPYIAHGDAQMRPNWPRCDARASGCRRRGIIEFTVGMRKLAMNYCLLHADASRQYFKKQEEMSENQPWAWRLMERDLTQVDGPHRSRLETGATPA